MTGTSLASKAEKSTPDPKAVAETKAAAEAAAAKAEANRTAAGKPRQRAPGAGRKGDAFVKVGAAFQPRAVMEQQTGAFLNVITDAVAARQGDHWRMLPPNPDVKEDRGEAVAIAAAGIRTLEAYGFFLKGIPPWVGFGLVMVPYVFRAMGGEFAKYRARREASGPEPPPPPARCDHGGIVGDCDLCGDNAKHGRSAA